MIYYEDIIMDKKLDFSKKIKYSFLAGGSSCTYSISSTCSGFARSFKAPIPCNSSKAGIRKQSNEGYYY